jgi:hypothetical protein
MIAFKDGQTTTGALIMADTEIVWNIITDTHLWPQWGPSVSVVECADRFINAKSRGRLQTPLGVWLPFTITAFEDMHFWSWRIGPLEATGHRVRQEGLNRSILIFSMPWWSTPYILVCNRALRRINKIAESYASIDMRQ